MTTTFIVEDASLAAMVRHLADFAGMTTFNCEHCGATVFARRRSRKNPRRYCTNSHKVAAWRAAKKRSRRRS